MLREAFQDFLLLSMGGGMNTRVSTFSWSSVCF